MRCHSETKLKITITILCLIIGTLVSLVYLQDRKIYVYQAHNEMQQRAIQKQDSLIHFLNEIKITKVTIIEKDTKDE